MKYQVQIFANRINSHDYEYAGVYKGNSRLRVLGWWLWAGKVSGHRVKVIRLERR